jgi:S1/P1 Nuclease
MWRGLFAGVLCAAPLSSALAWGDDGHRIVCEIAFLEMAPATGAKVEALLATDPQFADFAGSCAWADHPRKRDDEHYVNLPRDAGGLGAEACPLADRCVVTAVEKDVATLSSPTAGEVPRLMALKFLGHFMGDLHQPLHVSFQDDRGGNRVDTTGACGSSLHSAWDTCLLKKAVGSDPRAAAFALEAEVTAADRAAWVATGPTGWADESFAVTVAAGTQYCVAGGDACQYEAGNLEFDQDEPEKQVVIDGAYVAMSTPIIRDRLKRAGVRLAHVLDEALSD